MNELEEKFYETGVVPVVVLEDAEDAVPLAQALVEGGLLSAEVTFRTAAAEESIRRMTEAFSQMLVGAGTVLTKEQVDAAAAAGAKFIVSPGFDPEIVDYCLKKIEERGVYRIHQFEKQEMIVVCKPEESKAWYDKLWKNTVDLFRSLDIPVRTLECCSGDLADLKVKSCDVEAWSPRLLKPLLIIFLP